MDDAVAAYREESEPRKNTDETRKKTINTTGKTNGARTDMVELKVAKQYNPGDEPQLGLDLDVHNRFQQHRFRARKRFAKAVLGGS